MTCPHCGGELPLTKSQRRAAMAICYKKATDARAERDREDIYPLLRPIQERDGGFGMADIGEALMRVQGRKYGEVDAVIARGTARGWVLFAGLRGRQGSGRRAHVRFWKLAI